MVKKTSEFFPADRYKYDWGLCSIKNGFAQVDTGQDASYYGTWCNPFEFIIFNYCEGDCYTTKCDTKEEFFTEMMSVKEWNDKYSRFIGIDSGFNKLLKDQLILVGLRSLLH